MIVRIWMTEDVATIEPHTLIVDAAALMARRGIRRLPVVREERLVGLITESDIFRAFANLLTSPGGGVRITFDMSRGEDVFGLIAQVALKRGVRVVSLISSQQDNRPVCVVRLTGAGVDKLLDELWSSGHPVLNVLRFA